MRSRSALLLVAFFVVSAAAEVDEDPWVDAKPTGGTRKPTPPPDDRSFFQRYGVVIAYIILMVGMKIYGVLFPPEKVEPGGNVKSIHNNEDWQSLLQSAKETKQLVRAV